jgi:hypothetical protein
VLIQVLVRDQIEGGDLVLNALQAGEFPVSGAFWCRIPDQDYWQLIIASPFVSQFGPLAAYQRVQAILAKRPVPAVPAIDISIFSPIDPEYLRLREHAFGRGQFGVGPGAGVPRNTSFEDAWAYI